MLNILTIDIEDYFQVHAFSRVIRYEDWDKFECRIERNTDRLLEIFSSSIRNPHSVFRTQNSESNNSAPSSQLLKLQHSCIAAHGNSITHSPINSESNNSAFSP